MGIIIWKERLHVSRSSYPRTSGYSSIMDMSFLPMLSSLGNMGFAGLAVHPCRGWAHGQRSTIHHCPMHAQRQLSKAGSLALTAVEKCEYINILFLCVFVICMVCFMWWVYQCMESCVPTRKQVESQRRQSLLPLSSGFLSCNSGSCWTRNGVSDSLGQVWSSQILPVSTSWCWGRRHPQLCPPVNSVPGG